MTGTTTSTFANAMVSETIGDGVPPFGCRNKSMCTVSQNMSNSDRNIDHDNADDIDNKAGTREDGRSVTNGICTTTVTNTFFPKFEFPFKLHQILQDVESEDNEDIIRWTNNGKAFKIFDVKRFEKEILPRYFFSTVNSSTTIKYRSFQRQLNIYGYQQIKSTMKLPNGDFFGNNEQHDAPSSSSSPSSSSFHSTPKKNLVGAYFHPLFVKGCLQLCLQMKRVKIKHSHPRPNRDTYMNQQQPKHDIINKTLAAARDKVTLHAQNMPSLSLQKPKELEVQRQWYGREQRDYRSVPPPPSDNSLWLGENPKQQEDVEDRHRHESTIACLASDLKCVGGDDMVDTTIQLFSDDSIQHQHNLNNDLCDVHRSGGGPPFTLSSIVVPDPSPLPPHTSRNTILTHLRCRYGGDHSTNTGVTRVTNKGLVSSFEGRRFFSL